MPLVGTGTCTSTLKTNSRQLNTCLLGAISAPNILDAFVDCLVTHTKLDPGWTAFLGGFQQCLNNPEQCGEKELYVAPDSPYAQWTSVNPDIDLNLRDLLPERPEAFDKASLQSALENHRRKLENATESNVQFGTVTNIPASNGVVHQVSGVMIPTYTNEVPPEDPPGTEPVSDEAYAWIALGGTVGVLVGGMAFYQRHQMKKTPLYDADGYGDEGKGAPLIQNTDGV